MMTTIDKSLLSGSLGCFELRGKPTFIPCLLFVDKIELSGGNQRRLTDMT